MATAAPETTSTLTEAIEFLPIAKITPAKDNPRGKVGDVTELAESIKAVGLLEPVIVTPRDGGYLLVCGSRRVAGARKAGLDVIPAIVRELDERQRQEAMLVENLQREDLTPLEEATGYKRLLADVGLSQRELAGRVGRSQSHISKRLALLELPKAAVKELDSGGITLEDAVALSRLAEAYAAETAVPIEEGRFESFLQEVLEEEPGWRDVAGDVDAEIQTLERRRAELTKRAELEAKGLKVVDAQRPPKGAVQISKEGGYSTLKFAPAEHAKEPCHAVALNPRRPEDGLLCFCTDRKRHPKLKTGAESSRGRESAHDEKRRAHEKELGEAKTTRRELAGTIAQKKLPKDEAVELVVKGLIGRAEAEAEKVACQLLGIEPKKSRSQYGPIHDHEAALADLAAKSPAELLRVGVALALATDEAHLSASWWNSWGSAKPYFEFLERHGYKPTKAEKLKLAGKSP